MVKRRLAISFDPDVIATGFLSARGGGCRNGLCDGHVG